MMMVQRMWIAAAMWLSIPVSLCAGEVNMDAKIKWPQRLMSSEEVLRMVHGQTGAAYAYPTGALVRQIDATQFNGEATVRAAVAKLAPKVGEKDGVILLEADLPDAELRKLSDQLGSDKPDDRRVAAYLLGNTKSTKAVAPLFGALGDKDESVRHHALRSLDRLERDLESYCPPGRRSIFPLAYDKNGSELAEIMKSAPDAAANEWVWSAGIVGRLARPANARELLNAGTKHGYERTRTVAGWALARLEPPAIKEAGAVAAMTTAELIAQFEQAKDSEPKAALLLAIGRSGGKEAWDLILAQMDSKDAVIRRAAIRALDRCPDARAVDALFKILTGPDEPIATPEVPPEKGTPPSASTLVAEYRNLAAMSLGMIASPGAAKQLADYVAKTKSPVSGAALALSWMAEEGRADVAAGLIDCIKVKDEDSHNQQHCILRSFAYTGLARISTPEAVAAIMSKYDEYDNMARYAGHSAIRLSRGQAAVDRFVELVKAGKGRISAHGLEMAEDPRAVDVLIGALPTATEDRLNFALQSLGRIGDPKAVPTLAALLDHKEQWVQYEAFRALRWRWYWYRVDVQDALRKRPTFKSFVTPPPSLADQPENTWALRNWPIDFDDYRAVNTTYEAGMAFDESTGKAVKVNAHGQRCDTPQLGETWLYDPTSNTWSETKSPVQPFGMCGTWNLAYDSDMRKIVYLEAEGGHHGWQMERARALRGSTPWVYDGAADTWTPMNPLHMLSGPGLRAFGPMTFISSINKVFLHGSAWAGNSPKEMATRSWTYDTFTNTWTMLPESKENPGNPGHHAMCYMPNIDKVALAAGGRTWLFDPKTSQWTDAKAKGTPNARLPLVYDPVSETALLFIADSNGTHVWQYDAGANEWKRVDSPVDLSPHHDSVDCVYDPANNVFIMDGGHVNWNTDHIAVRDVWTYKFKNWPEGKPPQKRPYVAVRPQPPLPGDVVVNVLADGAVQVRANVSADFAGYNVYAATVGIGGKMHHKEVFKSVGEFVKLNKEPVKGGAFTDARKLAAASGLFNHEIRAYCVKTVDMQGRESGPSATVLTLTSSVPRVTAVEQPDGSTVIRWDASPEKDIRGYAVYRLDEFRTTLAVRLNPVPAKATQFVDWCESPRAERRRYYVVAVDALNQEGIPSTGAWSFGRP